jgi:hypothetical protein
MRRALLSLVTVSIIGNKGTNQTNKIMKMKKEYIAPAIVVVNIGPVRIMAGSNPMNSDTGYGLDDDVDTADDNPVHSGLSKRSNAFWDDIGW